MVNGLIFIFFSFRFCCLFLLVLLFFFSFFNMDDHLSIQFPISFVDQINFAFDMKRA